MSLSAKLRVGTRKAGFPAVLGLCLLLVLALPAMGAEQPTALLINSYNAGNPWVDGYTRALRAGLGNEVRLDTFDMDTKRLPASAFPQQADKAMAAVARLSPDIVIAADDNALKWIGERVLARGVPLVYLGINANPRDYLGQIHSATGVLERPLIKRSIAYISEILGGRLRRCLILFDAGWTSQILRENEMDERNSLQVGEVRAEARWIEDWGAWQETVRHARAEGYDALILASYHTLRDTDGSTIASDDAVRWTSAHTEVPPFALWDIHIGAGLAMGGYVISSEPQGEVAAQLVKRILAGESPQSIPPQTATRGRLVLSRSELERWRVDLPQRMLREATLVD